MTYVPLCPASMVVRCRRWKQERLQIIRGLPDNLGNFRQQGLWRCKVCEAIGMDLDGRSYKTRQTAAPDLLTTPHTLQYTHGTPITTADQTTCRLRGLLPAPRGCQRAVGILHLRQILHFAGHVDCKGYGMQMGMRKDHLCSGGMRS